MSFKSAIAAVLLMTSPAFAGDIMVTDAYARSASPMARTGAAFLVIENHGAADRLIGVASDVAKRVELHTHKQNADGVMSMMHVEEGFALPMHGTLAMQRGGAHVMFMGLNDGFEQGELVPLTLIFETAGEMQVEVPVDLERKAEHGEMDHGEHSHGTSE